MKLVQPSRRYKKNGNRSLRSIDVFTAESRKKLAHNLWLYFNVFSPYSASNIKYKRKWLLYWNVSGCVVCEHTNSIMLPRNSVV